MPREIEYRSRSELEAQWPAGMFARARELLFNTIWLDLPSQERRNTLAYRAYAAEDQLAEFGVVWRRLREGRIDQVEWNRRRDELEERLGVGNYTVGTGEHPELDALHEEERDREHAIMLDFKSLYVFGDLVLAAYVAMSEPVWEAPDGVRHDDGLSRFVSDVIRARDCGDIDTASPFAAYMDRLLSRLVSLEQSLGWYRDKWIVHLPPDMLGGLGVGIAAPLAFEVSHARRRQIEETQLRRLRRTVRQVEKREGLALGDDTHDPRPKLRKLALLLPELTDRANVLTVQRLLVEWGVHSPPLLPLAQRLAALLEDWSAAFAERVGYVKG